MSYHKKHTKNNIAMSIQKGSKPVSFLVFCFPAQGNHVSHSGVCSLYILFTSLNLLRLMILSCLNKHMYLCIKNWHIILSLHYRITDNSNNVDCKRLIIPKIRLYFKIYNYINRCLWLIWAKHISDYRSEHSTRTVSISKILFIKSKVQRLLPQKVLPLH